MIGWNGYINSKACERKQALVFLRNYPGIARRKWGKTWKDLCHYTPCPGQDSKSALIKWTDYLLRSNGLITCWDQKDWLPVEIKRTDYLLRSKGLITCWANLLDASNFHVTSISFIDWNFFWIYYIFRAFYRTRPSHLPASCSELH
jgi:hypothetical protein